VHHLPKLVSLFRFASVQEECDYFRLQYETTVQKVEEIQAESRKLALCRILMNTGLKNDNASTETLDELIETLNGLNQGLEESNEALEQRHKDDQEDIDALEKRVNALEDQLAKTGGELDQLKVSSAGFVIRALLILLHSQHKRVEEIKEHNATVATLQVRSPTA
jgi:wobble nucleotide-excising tRNase